MPRAARIDHPDLLQHVIVRGIEKKPIFLDDADRNAFLRRLSLLLVETGTECLAWTLMRNHAHFLLRPRRDKLSTFMRRLLTGYAVTFNLRHRRTGHLFQNRYKSIVCEEEPYLLELVRYIHLNPLRAGAVGDMDALDRYPWSGHAVLMGARKLTGQNSAEVLGRFGATTRAARAAYRQFVSVGEGEGEREELCGGGLRRVMMTGVEDKPRMYDERVLGSGEFVQGLLGKSPISSSDPSILPLEVLVEKVAEVFGVTVEDIRQPGRRKAVTDARSLISYLGFRRMGYTGEAVARILGITRSGVCRRSAAGEDLYRTGDGLRELFP
jgi:REP element-mobilizing transposase RayT